MLIHLSEQRWWTGVMKHLRFKHLPVRQVTEHLYTCTQTQWKFMIDLWFMGNLGKVPLHFISAKIMRVWPWIHFWILKQLSLSVSLEVFVWTWVLLKTYFAFADLANFVPFQGSHGSLPLASAAVFDLQTKIKEKCCWKQMSLDYG